jgi:hypothetical protein
MTTAEVMTVALVAATYLVGNQERSRLFLQEHGYIPARLSKSRFNRRLHALPDTLWQALFALLAEIAKQTNEEQIYLVDSLPVPVCDNIRIFRCRLYQDEAFRIKVASKKRYIYGLWVHLLVSSIGRSVQMVLAPASVGDITAFRSLPLDLPAGAEIDADAAYTDYLFEDTLAEVVDVHLIAHRKSNSKRPHPGWVAYLADRARKRVETTFSEIAASFGRNIHAVMSRGFELKVFLMVMAYAITA